MTEEIKNQINEIYLNDTNLQNNLEDLRESVQPHYNPLEVKEVYNNIIKEDSTYIKRYLISNSNIVYQKDILIDNKENFYYNSIINNDSNYLYFKDTRVLLVFEDYALNSEFHTYIFDLYINGVRLDEEYYALDPKIANYHFTSGSKRVFIQGDKINNGDLVSIVVRKIKKFNKSYVSFKVEKIPEGEEHLYFKFDSTKIGPCYKNFENLAVYRKSILNKYFDLMPLSDYCIFEQGGYFFINIFNATQIGDVYLIMNKLKFHEIRYDVDNSLELDEYLETDPIMQLSLTHNNEYVAGSKLPIPVSSVYDIECFIDGLKLVPVVDYIVDLYNTKNGPIIKFAGTLKPGSRVIIRNRLYSRGYGFNKHVTTMPVDGIIRLSDMLIPTDPNYIEAYAGRRRIPLSNKRNIADNILKIDNCMTLNDLDLHSEIDFTDYTYQLLNRYNESKNFLSNISSLFYTEVVDSFKANNDVKENCGVNDLVWTQDEVFIGAIVRIQIMASKTMITEGHYPDMIVLGFSKNSGVGIDVTNFCTFSEYDRFELGPHTITATYTFSNNTLTDSLDIEVVNKELVNLEIVMASNFFQVGDNIRNAVEVRAEFEDDSEKIVTSKCKIEGPIIAEEPGLFKITATLTYNNIEFVASKVVSVTAIEDRIITDMTIVLDNYITDENDTYTAMSIVAQYNNNLIQQLDPSIMDVYIVDDYLTDQPKFTKITNLDMVDFELNKTYIIHVDVWADRAKTEAIEMAESLYFMKMKVLSNVLENENRIVVFDTGVLYLHEEYAVPENAAYYRIRDAIDNSYITIGEIPINDTINKGLYFGNKVANNVNVIVEFFDSDHYLIANVLFKLKDIESYKKDLNIPITGSPVSGYTINIPKLNIGKGFEEVTGPSEFTLELINKVTGEVVASFDRFIDEAKDLDEHIMFKFINFNTTDGNVKRIKESIKNGLKYVDIKCSTISSDINLHGQFNVVNTEYTTYRSMTIWKDDTLAPYIAVRPMIPNSSEIGATYLATPKRDTIEPYSFSSLIKFLCNSDNSLVISDFEFGERSYYIYTTDSSGVQVIHEINLTIGKDEEHNGMVRILKVNETPLNYEEYCSIV